VTLLPLLLLLLLLQVHQMEAQQPAAAGLRSSHVLRLPSAAACDLLMSVALLCIAAGTSAGSTAACCS
jgi:hypothetical protein